MVQALAGSGESVFKGWEDDCDAKMKLKMFAFWSLLWIYFCPLTSLTNISASKLSPPFEDPHGCYRCNVALLCVNLKLQDSG